MASTNKTTNYELSQYVGSDKPTYLGDYNSDMLKIDTQMKSNATAVATAQSTADTASTNANTAITNAGTAQSTADTANTTANSALTKATANETDINFLKTINNITISSIESGVTFNYEFEQIGNIYMLDLTVSVTGVSNSWKKLGSISTDYIPNQILNTSTVINSNNSGSIIGYGMLEIELNGDIRIRANSTFNENIYARCLFTWIHQPTV